MYLSTESTILPPGTKMFKEKNSINSMTASMEQQYSVGASEVN